MQPGKDIDQVIEFTLRVRMHNDMDVLMLANELWDAADRYGDIPEGEVYFNEVKED